MTLPLSERIRRAREDKGLTQEQLAEAVGVSQRTIGNWERGASVPRNRLGRLENILDVSLRLAPDDAMASDDTDGPETLQRLVLRRMAQLGIDNAHQLFLRGGGRERWNYETVRQIVGMGHRNLEPETVERLADTLGVSENRIRAAAGQRPRGEPFDLGEDSAQLSQAERRILRTVMYAILGSYADDENAGDAAPSLPTPRHLRRLDFQEPDFTQRGAARNRTSPDSDE